MKKVSQMPHGRRPLEPTSGNPGNRRKRPLAAEISKTAQQPLAKKPKNLHAPDENIPSADLNTRITRSGRRLAK
ncbi:hypothetical protein GALMADRAFT_244915 [Galerina marginata CBS 339.88]|uniref:Uncharacterized protein n=1 Tax=Galerina marginata (strain CBS 339.88) TaxID=685588 RepID=A0A067T6L0_GALM3|nr:hypothetical protein GALMADRAFT_244915 [Galerina marginata CBS 339.88]